MTTDPTENSDDLQKIPIGIPDLDENLNGGVRPGTNILPIGPVGTGAMEFARSCAIMHGAWQAESDLFELEYGDVARTLDRPNGVRYYSLTDDSERLRHQMEALADPQVVETALDHVSVHSFADAVADLGSIRVAADGRFEYGDPGSRGVNPYQAFLRAFGDHLSADLSNEVVILDSITDLVPMMNRYLSATDLYFTAQTVCYHFESSDSILIAPANSDFLTRKERAYIERPFETVLHCDWFGAGGHRRRSIELSKFPEYWTENPETERVVFDVTIDRNQFGISSVEKIPPRS